LGEVFLGQRQDGNAEQSGCRAQRRVICLAMDGRQRNELRTIGLRLRETGIDEDEQLFEIGTGAQADAGHEAGKG